MCLSMLFVHLFVDSTNMVNNYEYVQNGTFRYVRFCAVYYCCI